MISIKSKTELALMKKAGEIVAVIHKILKEEIKPGVTTQHLDDIVEKYIRDNGAVPSFKGYKGMGGAADYPASICASVNNEVVHGIPGLRMLKDGDIISIDVGVYLNGYHADAARTFSVGQISPEAERLINVTKQSFYEGLKYALIGNRIADISSAIQRYVEGNGYSVVREYVGHGIGRDMHEPPQIPNYLTKQRGPRMQAGMTLAIEPMVNEGKHSIRLQENGWTVVTEDGSLSAHYENTVAIDDSGPVIMTSVMPT